MKRQSPHGPHVALTNCFRCNSNLEAEDATNFKRNGRIDFATDIFACAGSILFFVSCGSHPDPAFGCVWVIVWRMAPEVLNFYHQAAVVKVCQSAQPKEAQTKKWLWCQQGMTCPIHREMVCQDFPKNESLLGRQGFSASGVQHSKQIRAQFSVGNLILAASLAVRCMREKAGRHI